jgi:hypothetical protein
VTVLADGAVEAVVNEEIILLMPEKLLNSHIMLMEITILSAI